jgi:hypothetical protein
MLAEAGEITTNDFPNKQNFMNNFLFFSTISKVIRNSRVKRHEPRRGSS